MAKVLKKDGKMYIELPESLYGKKIKAIRLADEIFVVASDEAIKKLLERQMYYVIQRRIQKKLVNRPSGNPRAGAQQQGRNGLPEFTIIESDEQARAFSRRYAAQFRSGQILGVKGFDGKYYVVRADVYDRALQKIREILEQGSAGVKDLAAKSGLSEKLVRAVLEIAREDGIVYEMPGGKYAYAG